jgi:alpha-galactosidase
MGWMHVPLVEYQGGGNEATIEPLAEHLPHYGQRLSDLFGAGVQAAWRGKRLYDTPETLELVKKWVSFYKKHRAILDADIIHVRRPDGRDIDAILHVNPSNYEKGLLMVYNPLDRAVKKEITINIYYTGLSESALISENDGNARRYNINRNYEVTIPVNVEANSQSWYILK